MHVSAPQTKYAVNKKSDGYKYYNSKILYVEKIIICKFTLSTLKASSQTCIPLDSNTSTHPRYYN